MVRLLGISPRIWLFVVGAALLGFSIQNVLRWQSERLGMPVGHGAAMAIANPHEIERVNRLAVVAKNSDAELLFLGDSITAQWELQGWDTWHRFYGQRQALNLGVGWAQTGNLLWRIERGDLDLLEPKLLVLMIGTNNSQHGRHRPEEIYAGVERIVDLLSERFEAARFLVLGILPRGRQRDDRIRANNEAANRLLAGLDGRERVRFLDIGEAFLQGDGSLAPELFTDYLHLSGAGYSRWAESIEGDVAELLASAQE